MYGYYKGEHLSSNFLNLGGVSTGQGASSRQALTPIDLKVRLEKGGLAQITSSPGGSKTWFALACLGQFLKSYQGDPPLSLWISEEGLLYPESVILQGIPLSRLLMVKVMTSSEAWKIALEAMQTGLFAWLLLRTAKPCLPAHLRKLQLCAEQNQSRMLLLSQASIPHWTLKAFVAVNDSRTNSYAHSLFSKQFTANFLQRGLSFAYAEDFCP
jgi:hypothetical protein